MKYEYVASGLSMSRLCTRRYAESERLIAASKEVLSSLQNKDGIHNVSLLFNSYAETQFGPWLQQVKDDVHSIHADSGGLQIVTQGKSITSDIKQQVYKNQGTYADIGMSFDEMPLKIVNEKCGRTDMSGRKYISEWSTAKGVESGKNILKQIEVYQSIESSCKPMIICQGNRPEDFQRYFDGIMSVIPQEHYKNIGGIAIAATCVGIGTLEGIDSIISYKKMNIPSEFNKKIHFLGYGSLTRLMPLLMLSRSGFLGDGLEISYDSTTHTSRYFMGGFYSKQHKMVDFGRSRNPVSLSVAAEIYDIYGHIVKKYFGVDKDEYVMKVTDDVTSSAKFNTEDTDYNELQEFHVFLNAFASVYNFTSTVTEFLVGDDSQFFTTKKSSPLYYLRNVKTVEDFDRWHRNFAKYVDSNRVEVWDNEQGPGGNFDITDLFG